MSREEAETYALAGLGLMEGVFNYYIRPELTARRGWLAIGALVAAYELACPEGELLSQGFDRALEKHKVATVIGTLAVTGHLLNVFREDVDPIHQLVKVFKK